MEASNQIVESCRKSKGGRIKLLCAEEGRAWGGSLSGSGVGIACLSCTTVLMGRGEERRRADEERKRKEGSKGQTR